MRLINIVYILLLLSLAACEKVVYIDLNTVNPKLVVEGNVTDQPGPYTVKLSNTVDYYQDNVFPAVGGANVTISDNAGNSELLRETSAGIYQTSLLQGVSGRAYSLNIITKDNGSYTAQSTMPSPVSIDSVVFTLNNRGTGYRVRCYFLDPVGALNFYKLTVNSNDSANLDTTNIRIIKDGLADGTELSLTYRTSLQPGDTVNVMLECIDQGTYTFYSTMANVEGGIRSYVSSPPSNPVSNITNGGLGYFSAHTITKQMAIVH